MNFEVMADTSFVVAVAIQSDHKHTLCRTVFKQYSHIGLSQATFAEIAYMLNRAAGTRAVSHFFRHLPGSKYITVPFEDEDSVRTAVILDKYADSRVDFVDASIAALAERLKISRILTLDTRDFQILRPAHVDRFEILP
ncbi:MAG: PIN domain-containing protein [Anaerolineae bacterium]